ncbi:DUF262 domain-containing protein [Clostridiaceae bacterium UIB06]|uniref:DUF262 domain-containing protein n=1 Tax=Clostridium thailandense TaxID=2794346 RepID=A0A949TK38_9CLOT|nr:DUF262 domain-containing protein [Clostridium thailandense]MBV7273765.1 DUF262 domain-containing protein [Clostridium thailandense]MCH5137455.1 DUF262 domain-containing protein [Clostridiaceae bacterium UIB06]
MTSGKIDANKEVLQKIFSQDFWFVIPEYQRSYVWQKDNVLDLLDDLFFAYENKPENEYFLGSLVLKRIDNHEFDEYEVLDGQQRLTTFFMMLAVLRDLIDNNDSKNVFQEMIYQKEIKLKKIPSRQRITYHIRDSVEAFIKEFIISENGTLSEIALGERAKEENVSISNMANAIIVMREFLTNKGDLESFGAFLLNNALFIYVSTDNTEDAFRLFTILNDRGIPLTNADILKSLNIGKIKDEKEVQLYARKWEELESKYGEKFDRFLYFIRNIFVKEKARTNLLEEYETNIYKKDKLKMGQETIEHLICYDEIYDNVIELQGQNLSNEYKNLITIMKIGLPSEEWIPAVLFYYRKFKTDKLLEFLKKLEFKVAGDWICQVSPTMRLEAINKVMKEIEACKIHEIDTIMQNEELFDIDIKFYKSAISSDVYNKRYCKYLLLKLEYLLSDNTVHLSNYNKISVEHVLPQNPGRNSDWVRVFTEDERNFWTHKIANLVLISKIKNSKLSNLDFEEKKEKYLKQRIDVFYGNKIFIENNNEWSPEILKKRQKELVELLVKNR